MYFLDTATAVASIHTFWDALKTWLPNNVHVQVVPSGDTIEDTTGDLVGTWAADPVTEVVGVYAGAHAAPVGACADWITATILDLHRLRGRTFIVPTAQNAFQDDGTLGVDFLAALDAAQTAFVIAQDASFVVWHRPRAAQVGPPVVAARLGGHGLVTGSRVTDKAAVLRIRRD